MTLRDINMVWIGSKLSRIERMCMTSFLYYGHQLNLYCYQDIDGVPDGVTIKDANAIVPEKKVFLHKDSYAAFADLFRWKLMQQGLGWYMDADVVCLRPLDIDSEIFISYQDKGNVITPTAMLFATSHHPFVDHMVFRAEHPLRLLSYESFSMHKKKIETFIRTKNKAKALGWGTTAGPEGVTTVINKCSDLIDFPVYSKDYFFHIPWQDWETLLDGRADEQKLLEISYGVHLWNELWRRNGIDKNGEFLNRSLVGSLLRKFKC